MAKDMLEDYDFEDVLLSLGIRKISDINNTEKLKELFKKLEEKYIGTNLANIQDSIKLCGLEILTLEKEKKDLLNNKSLDEEAKKQIESIDYKIQKVKEKQDQYYDKKEDFHKTIEVQMNEYLGQIYSLESKLSNNLQILYHIMNLKYNLIKQLEIKEKNKNLHEFDYYNNTKVLKDEKMILREREIISMLCNKLKTLEEFFKYMYNNLEIIQRTDWSNRDLSSRIKYSGSPNYDRYDIKYVETPEKLLDCKIDGKDIYIFDEREKSTEYEQQKYDERIRVYNIGEFKYKVAPLNYISVHQVIAVCKEDREGNLRFYNGIIYINKNFIMDNPEFYAKIVFSDSIMQNAEKNNYGFIGDVVDQDGSERLIYSALGLDDIMKNLYAANHVENGRMIQKSLPALYSHMNNIITMQIEKEKQLVQNKRGGR